MGTFYLYFKHSMHVNRIICQILSILSQHFDIHLPFALTALQPSISLVFFSTCSCSLLKSVAMSEILSLTEIICICNTELVTIHLLFFEKLTWITVQINVIHSPAPIITSSKVSSFCVYIEVWFFISSISFSSLITLFVRTQFDNPVWKNRCKRYRVLFMSCDYKCISFIILHFWDNVPTYPCQVMQ